METVKEIERKFTLKYELRDQEIQQATGCYPLHFRITQHYLPNGMRVRKTVVPGCSETFTMTLKGKSNGPFSRKEWETEIPKWVYDEIAARDDARTIEKTRRSWEKDGRQFEYDQFAIKDDFELHLLEVEFKNIEDAIAFDPNSLGLPLEAEVTYDPAFQNYNIAMERG